MLGFYLHYSMQYVYFISSKLDIIYLVKNEDRPSLHLLVQIRQ